MKDVTGFVWMDAWRARRLAEEVLFKIKEARRRRNGKYIEECIEYYIKSRWHPFIKDRAAALRKVKRSDDMYMYTSLYWGDEREMKKVMALCESRTERVMLSSTVMSAFMAHGVTEKSTMRRESSDKKVVKYIHPDGSETAVKFSAGCSSQRKKFTVFASVSSGCSMSCRFCHLTVDGVPHRALSAEQIESNLKEAISSSHRPDHYIKLSWMGMGEPLLYPMEVMEVSKSVVNWAISHGFAAGLDGVDIGTVLPPRGRWISYLHQLEKDLRDLPFNPENGGRPRVRLFYSLHATDEKVRSRLIPCSLTLKMVVDVLKLYSSGPGDLIFHSMFLKGHNESPEDTYAWVQENFPGYQLRALRYNGHELCDLEETPGIERLIEAVKEKAAPGTFKNQVSDGSEIRAACGQFVGVG
jgi:adenine C2-methylase RlmN of 23S rRNA A2503 and tRNA A37